MITISCESRDASQRVDHERHRSICAGSMINPMLTRTSSRLKQAAIILASAVVITLSSSNLVFAAAEDILVGAFDKITGVPVMGAMLELVRSGESNSQAPDALDRRLREVEKLLQSMDSRLKQVEVKVGQLQNEVVKLGNINRLRELQRIRAELAEINAEMLTRPVDPARLAILEFRARQQADILKNNVDFDIWKWSDIDPVSGLIRTRFHVLPSFELYGLALTTWFAAIDMKSGAQPQRIVADSGAALREHATFLRLRDGWRELRTNETPNRPTKPVTLLENLYTAAFCRLEAAQTFADHSGNCVLAEVCIDTMEDKSTETGRITLTMQPPTVGTLCTWNPDLARNITGEDKLRAEYGGEVMTAFANALDRLATTGSLRESGGTFDTRVPESVLKQKRALYALNIDEPLIAPPGAAIDVQLKFQNCHSSARVIAGCQVTPKYEEWSYDPATRRLLHVSSGKCLNISGARHDAGAPIILYPCSGAPNEKWTVISQAGSLNWTVKSDLTSQCLHAIPGRSGGSDRLRMRVATPATLVQMPCNGSDAQRFSSVDADWFRRNGPR